MRAGFTAEVRAIEAEIEAQLGQAVRTLDGLEEVILDPGAEDSQRLIASGRELRQLSRGMDVRLVTLSATQAPVACDLRLVLTMMQIVQHQGLIGNQFVLIGEQVQAIDPSVADRCGSGEKAAEMAGLARTQLAAAVRAFAQRDPEAAEGLVISDDRLDRLNKLICRSSLEMRVSPAQRELAFRHVLIARSLERIGDNAVGIARHTAELVRADVHRLAVAGRD